MPRLEVGQTAPELTLTGPGGAQVDLRALREQAEKGVVVYFYPRAGTPGCTKEACDFRDSLTAWRQAGYEVVGVSPDSPEALTRFAHNQQLPFTLACDQEHSTMEAWGAWGTKQSYGRQVTGVIRSTVVVDRQGVVVLARYNVKATGHVARLRRELGLEG